MDLRNIAKVAHTDRADEVNKLLEGGWVLLSVQGGLDEEGRPTFWHALGLPEDPVALAIELFREKRASAE